MKKTIISNIVENKDIERKSIFWNMTFSVLSALQSAFMLMIVTRIIGTEDAGILSIAFATAYLMSTIGMYGVRNFHATDSQNRYSYNEYKKVRLISCAFMFLCSLIYCFWKDYDGHKTNIVLLVCLLKLEESIEDLYHGELQRGGRLDIAGLLGTVRLTVCYVVFIFYLFITPNLELALWFMIVLSFIMIIYTRFKLDVFLIKEVGIRREENVLRLIASCFPIFVMMFLSIYITNAPKYAIDVYLSEQDQAYYAIISMPLFTINLFSSVIYRPKLLQMSELWNNGDIMQFKNLLWKQIRNIILLSIIITVAGLVVGLNILEILYGVSLTSLKKEFLILLVGGGLVALYNFVSVCLTVIRKQSFMFVTSISVMVFSVFISNPAVKLAGLTGASYLYSTLMLAELIMASTVLCIYVKRKYRSNVLGEVTRG